MENNITNISYDKFVLLDGADNNKTLQLIAPESSAKLPNIPPSTATDVSLHGKQYKKFTHNNRVCIV